MRRVLLVLGLVIALLIPATTTAAADWSMAGGDAARTGSTNAEPSTSPAVLWEAPVSGPVLTAPVVARNPGPTWEATVYAVSGGPLTLNAVNASDGVLRWSTSLSSFAQPPWVVRRQGGLAADGDRAYALLTEQNGTLPEWRDVLFAWNRANGSEVWNVTGAVYTSVGTPAIDSAPLLVRDLVVFGSGDGHVRALQAPTGGLVWDAVAGARVSLPVTFLETGVALVGDFILAENDNDQIVALDVNGSANGDQGIVDPPGTGDVVWITSLGTNAVSSAVATPAAAYAAAGSRVFSLHPAFGNPMWSQDVSSAVTGPLALAGNVLVFGSIDGKVRALNTTTGAVEWVRALGGLQPWLVSTPQKIFTGAGDSMVALNATTGDMAWTGKFGSPVGFASVSENATGKGTIYGGMSSPDRVVAFGGSSDLRPLDISVAQIPNPNAYQASIDATIVNSGDENVSRNFWVSVTDSFQGDDIELANATVPYLRSQASFRVTIDSWNFTSGQHTISVEIQKLPEDRNPDNNTASYKFFATVGPPRVFTEWSPAFWIGLIVVGVAGLGAGWLIAVAGRRREREAAEMARSRQESRP